MWSTHKIHSTCAVSTAVTRSLHHVGKDQCVKLIELILVLDVLRSSDKKKKNESRDFNEVKDVPVITFNF